MRNRYLAVCFLTVVGLLFTNCSHSTPTPTSFVNQADPSQHLDLIVDGSQTSNLFIRASIDTGANKYFGKTVGVFVLKTATESTGGRFVSVLPLRGNQLSIALTANDGRKWSLDKLADGTFRDTNGTVWR